MLTPVKWKFAVEERNGESYVVAKATIDKGWHVYSKDVPKDGPLPTLLTLKASKQFKVIGKVKEGKSIEKMDNMFGAVIKYFEDKAEFSQKIKVLSSEDFTLKGELEAMACNDNQCLPPDVVEFELKVKANTAQKKNLDSALVPSVGQTDDTSSGKDSSLKIQASSNPIKLQVDTAPEASSSLLAIFLGGFWGGFLALLTPCVFPMIPLTVSFFTKRAASRSKGIASALFYAGSIIGVYTGFGMLITVGFGADALNEMASNGFVNIFFFIVFAVFATSFLGAFFVESRLKKW